MKVDMVNAGRRGREERWGREDKTGGEEKACDSAALIVPLPFPFRETKSESLPLKAALSEASTVELHCPPQSSVTFACLVDKDISCDEKSNLSMIGFSNDISAIPLAKRLRLLWQDYADKTMPTRLCR
jgi:hypothetical protein